MTHFVNMDCGDRAGKTMTNECITQCGVCGWDISRFETCVRQWCMGKCKRHQHLYENEKLPYYHTSCFDNNQKLLDWEIDDRGRVK